MEGLLIVKFLSLGSFECFKVLISSGASLSLADKRGLTPLHLAVITSHQTMIDYLVGNFADQTACDEQGNKEVNSNI